MAPAPHLGPPKAVAPEMADAPESWVGTTVQPIEEISDVSAGPITLQPARIIAVGPPSTVQTVTATLRTPSPIYTPPPSAIYTPPPSAIYTPPPPAATPYAVVDNEQTLLDHRPDVYPHAGESAPVTEPRPELQSTQMVALRPPMQAAIAVRTVESTPPPGPSPLDHRRDRQLVDPRLVLLCEPDSQRSASFRLLRDNLLAKKAPRIIAVSSGAIHEGKTTCAINLALALSEQPSTRVLLLEGNFFAPSLGRIFHIDAMTPPAPHMNLPWLTPYRIAEIMRGFHVAAVVQQKGEPAPIFNSRWFDMVIGHLSGADYDHLIIDAAALDGSPAVTQVVGVADGTLLTVQSGGTTARSFRRAAEQIPQGRALGVTLMDGDS